MGETECIFLENFFALPRKNRRNVPWLRQEFQKRLGDEVNPNRSKCLQIVEVWDPKRIQIVIQSRPAIKKSGESPTVRAS
eukprot:3259874-Prymnesium_polylepis.1